MATAPAALPVLPPIVARIGDRADMRLGRPDLVAAGRAAEANAPKLAPVTAQRRATPCIAIIRSRGMMDHGRIARVRGAHVMMVRARMAHARMAHARGAHVMMVRALGASRARTAPRRGVSFSRVRPRMAHRVASSSRARLGMGRRSACPLPHTVTGSLTQRATRRMRRRAPSGCTAITRSPPRWPIRTAGCGACW
jgi:hypothetical protein